MLVRQNKGVGRDYHILKKYQAGIVLAGWEVKSIKAGNVDIQSSYVMMRDGELWIRNMIVAIWSGAVKVNEDSRSQDRKLLVTRKELDEIASFTRQQQRTTMLPLSIAIAHGMIKVNLAIVKSKRKYEKKSARKNADMQRKMKLESRTLY